MGIFDIFKPRVKDGEHVTYYPNSDVIGERINCKGGQLNGLTTLYYVDGEKFAELPYKDDQLNGKAVFFSKHEMVIDEIDYQKGELDGKHIIYDHMGEIFWEICYEDGELIDHTKVKNWESFKGDDEKVWGYDLNSYSYGFLNLEFDDESPRAEQYTNRVVLMNRDEDFMTFHRRLYGGEVSGDTHEYSVKIPEDETTRSKFLGFLYEEYKIEKQRALENHGILWPFKKSK